MGNVIVFLLDIWIKDFILTVNKYNFILKILLDQNARSSGIYTERKKDRPEDCSFYITRIFTGLSVHMTISGSVTCCPTGKACGRSSVGPAPLVIYFLWQFILLSVRLLFLLSLQPPLGLPTAVSGTGSQQSALLSQSLLSRLFNCAEDHVTFILPNNNSLWVICS